MFPGFDPIGFVLGVLVFIGVPWITVLFGFVFFLGRKGKTLPLEVVDMQSPVLKTASKRKRRPEGLRDEEILVALQQIERIQDKFNMQLKE